MKIINLVKSFFGRGYENPNEQKILEINNLLEKDYIFFVNKLDEEPEILEEDDSYFSEKIIESATNLPVGWYWHKFDDGSGCLRSPDGKEYFDYDLLTNEYKLYGDDYWDVINEHPYESVDFEKFKQSAEHYIQEHVIAI